MKSFLFTAVFLFGYITSLSQAVLTGKITDSKTGESLGGATINIVNTKRGGYSNRFGSYTIKGIQPNTYSVRFSYVGYETLVIDSVKIIGTDTLDVQLIQSKMIGKEVVITAERGKDNAASLLVDRKNASQISDGIGKEEISKLPDSDAGQALKRVSGITLVEGKFIFVRGLSDRYSNTTLNGSTLSSTEQDKKSFAFDMFPSELLENANVIKSFTPDLPGNFSGGLVQLNTINFPLTSGFKISTNLGYNSDITFKQDKMLITAGGSTDWLGIDDGSRSLPQNFPKDRKEMNTLLQGVRSSNPNSIQRMNEIGQSFNNGNWKTGTGTAMPNGSLSLSYKEVIEIDEENKFGIVGSLNYGTSVQNTEMIRAAILSNPNDLLFQTNGFSTSQTFSWSGLLNFGYRIGDQTTLSFKNVYNRSADIDNTYVQGENFAQGSNQKMFSFEYVEKCLYSTTISGEHKFGLDWKFGYSSSVRDEPDFRRLQFLRQSSEIGSPLFSAIEITQQGAGSRAGRFYSYLTDDVYNGSLNYTIPIEETKIKIGGMGDWRKRNFNARSITIVQGIGNDLYELYQIPDNNVIPDLSSMFTDSAFRVDLGRLHYSEDSRLSDAYDGEESLYAGYGMIDFPLGKFRFIGGVRVEYNRQILNSFSINDQPVNINRTFVDILPAANFVYRLTDETNLRVSLSQTLSRPTFRELAPFQFYDFQIQSSVVGNPNLVRSLIQNGDIRFEWFPSAGEVMSVSGFYKRFNNAIEETLVPQSSEVSRSFSNANGVAQNYGVEIEVRKSFGFIWNELSDLFVSFNGAIIQSEIEVNQGGITDKRTMWGQSPFTLNLSIFYTNHKTNTTITGGYNTYGKRIIQVNQVGVFQGNPHIYELPRDVIDFSIIQRIGERMDIKLAVRDLLNQPLIWEQQGKIIQSNIRGTTTSISFGYKF